MRATRSRTATSITGEAMIPVLKAVLGINKKKKKKNVRKKRGEINDGISRRVFPFYFFNFQFLRSTDRLIAQKYKKHWALSEFAQHAVELSHVYYVNTCHPAFPTCIRCQCFELISATRNNLPPVTSGPNRNRQELPATAPVKFSKGNCSTRRFPREHNIFVNLSSYVSIYDYLNTMESISGQLHTADSSPSPTILFGIQRIIRRARNKFHELRYSPYKSCPR